jgi:uncharacterized protein YutE (UPF0331/DUF86 family)
MSDVHTRDVLLETLLPQYQAEGFEVFLNPSPSILPPFMHEYRPDAVALRPDRKIAIEVVRPSETSSRKVQDLKSLFAPHSDWELRVFYVSSSASEKSLDVVSPQAIRNSIDRVRMLKSAGHLLPALIMAWATLEGVGRALLPESLKRPQTPRRLVEVLAEAGYVTPEEADLLRAEISLRNEAVHGRVDLIVDENQLDGFLEVLETLIAFLPEGRPRVL